ncbi:hypothetical protein SprV_0602079900 [Sparganum proliferum]
MQRKFCLCSLVLLFSILHVGCGTRVCTWSQRLIPKNAAGNITIDVPIVDSYWRGYVGNEAFWTYIWARGWCSHKEGYFRCLYITHNGSDATRLTFPDAKKISYVMLRDEYPITVHKAEDESIPGFYVKEGTKLDVCPEGETVELFWTFNGNETDLKDISCYTNGRILCSGLRSSASTNDGKCEFTRRNGRVTVGYRVHREVSAWTLYYCHANKEQTMTMTYLVDWRGASSKSSNKKDPLPVPPQITTSGTERVTAIRGAIFVGLWMIMVSRVCIQW